MSVRYKRDAETERELAELRKFREDLRAIVDHFQDFGPDAAFQEKIERAARKLDEHK